MVTQWGMSDALGPMVYGENEGEVFLGRSITTHKNVSEATMQKVDAEIRRIIDEQYALARRLIEENRDKVEAMAKALLEWETHRRRPDQRHHGGPAAAPAEAGCAGAAAAAASPTRRARPRRRCSRRTDREPQAQPEAQSARLAWHRARARFLASLSAIRNDPMAYPALRPLPPRRSAVRSSWAWSTSRPIRSPTAGAMASTARGDRARAAAGRGGRRPPRRRRRIDPPGRRSR